MALTDFYPYQNVHVLKVLSHVMMQQYLLKLTEQREMLLSSLLKSFSLSLSGPHLEELLAYIFYNKSDDNSRERSSTL